jgi:altronate dehydratase small subunit
MTEAPASTHGGWDALVIHPEDDVAVVLRDVRCGESLRVRRAGSLVGVAARHDIPLGHKVALRLLRKGDAVRKYGECIGVTTVDIEPGSHVHVHNMTSRRARTAP